MACLTTAVGLLPANAAFFAKVFPKVTYQTFLIIFTVFSFGISNFGLSKLISISLPVLLIIYPIAIVLMVLALIGNVFNHSKFVYSFALIITTIISLYDGIKAAGFEIPAYESVLEALPLYDQSIGWLIPMIIAAIIGYIVQMIVNMVSTK